MGPAQKQMLAKMPNAMAGRMLCSSLKNGARMRKKMATIPTRNRMILKRMRILSQPMTMLRSSLLVGCLLAS